MLLLPKRINRTANQASFVHVRSVAVVYASPDCYHDFFYINARYSIQLGFQWRERRLKIRWLRLILIGGVVVVEKHRIQTMGSLSPPILIFQEIDPPVVPDIEL